MNTETKTGKLWKISKEYLANVRKLIGSQEEKEPKFVDLAPTDQADEDGIYGEALHFATNNPRVFNIALTGPYGSGKSSIIRSFLADYPGSTLNISLAAFVPDASSVPDEASAPDDTSPSNEITKQEIERSILQQMLYGADSNNLPFSRFKRIQTPGKWKIAKSLTIVLGLIACWHLFGQRSAIFDGTYFLPFDFSNWLNLTFFLIGILFCPSSNDFGPLRS